MSTRQQRSRQMLDEFRQRQQEATSEQKRTSHHQEKKIKKTLSNPLSRMMRPQLVAQFTLNGEKAHLYYIHRHADIYGQVMISACNRARTHESVELPCNGDDPFWILAQPHDWFISGVKAFPSCLVQKCYWQGFVQTKPLLYSLERLLPRLDHE